jgi:type IV pilus assembly protein PilQ
MRTSAFALLALLSTQTAVVGFAQPKAEPAAPAAPVAAPAVPEVAVKEEPAHPGVATKGKDAAGRDTLSVDFPDEDVRNILRNVADLFELNLVIPEGLQGKASIKLRDVSWRQIFQVVLTPIGYSYVEEGNIIKVVSNETLQQEPVTTEVFIINYAKASELLPTVRSLVSSQGSKIDIDTRSNSLIITEAPSRMNRIRPIIEQLDRATDQVMIESKFVEVTDGDVRNIGVNWASLKNYKVAVGGDDKGKIGTYDRLQGQDRSNGSSGSNTSSNNTTGGNNTNTTGTQTSGSNATTTLTTTNGTPNSTSTTGVTNGLSNTVTTTVTGGTTTAAGETLSLLNSLTNTGNTQRALSAVFTADQFGLVLSALNELTTAKVVSNPTVVTLNNTEAFINIGKEYPIPRYTYNEQRGSFEVAGFDYKPIGIILKVTPQVNARGFIKLMIEPEVSSFNDADSVNFGGAASARIPVIQTKKARTQISLKDGFTMGIGGLIDSTSSNTDTKVPVLGSIPVLGRLFSSKSRSTQTHNLLIFLTAKTLPSEGAPLNQVFDSRQIRQMHLKADELPGYRDGSDPFAPEPDAKADKKARKSK